MDRKEVDTVLLGMVEDGSDQKSRVGILVRILAKIGQCRDSRRSPEIRAGWKRNQESLIQERFSGVSCG